MSDKFKPYRQDRRPKKFKSGDNFSDYGENRKGISKQERRMRRDISWKREFVNR